MTMTVTIRGEAVCSTCGASGVRLHRMEVAHTPMRLCDGCNEAFLRRFLAWLTQAAANRDRRERAREARRMAARG